MKELTPVDSKPGESTSADEEAYTSNPLKPTHLPLPLPPQPATQGATVAYGARVAYGAAPAPYGAAAASTAPAASASPAAYGSTAPLTFLPAPASVTAAPHPEVPLPTGWARSGGCFVSPNGSSYAALPSQLKDHAAGLPAGWEVVRTSSAP